MLSFTGQDCPVLDFADIKQAKRLVVKALFGKLSEKV
jgi:hypothetical protein